MKTIVLALAMSLSAVAEAENATTCFVAASVGEAIAEMRDDGVKRDHVEILVQMKFDAEMHEPALDQLIEAVYEADGLSTTEIYSGVLATCTALTIPI